MYIFELRPETYPQIGMSDKDLLKSTRLFAVNALLTFLRKERRMYSFFTYVWIQSRHKLPTKCHGDGQTHDIFH